MSYSLQKRQFTGFGMHEVIARHFNLIRIIAEFCVPVTR